MAKKKLSIADVAQEVQRHPSEAVTQLKANLLDVSDRSGELKQVPIEDLRPNPFQPRRFSVNDPELQEMADSIREQGIIQPIIARRSNANPPFEILAGERRWRAAQSAGLTRVPVIVRNADDRDAAVIALLENLQRSDLNPIEEATALQRLSDEFHLQQTDVAKALGRSKTAISRSLGLLALPEEVRELLISKELSAGHGRVLLDLDRGDQVALARKSVDLGWSVRDLERHKALLLKRRAPRSRGTDTLDANIKALQSQLSQHLAAPVVVKSHRRGGGKIIISFNSTETCQSVLQRMGFRDSDDLEE